MNKHRNRIAAWLLGAATAALSGAAAAATLNDVFAVSERLNTQARQSQAKIDALTEETRELLGDYKQVLKEIEGLRVYNRQLEKQISNQEAEMATLTSSIDEVTVIERQITPLMLRMIDGLEQFVELDLPFLRSERADRLQQLVEMMDRADVAVSEKLSQILRAFQIENEYGRTMEAYSDDITLAGVERKVDVLKIGRIALLYQTPDGEETGMYNIRARQWEQLDDSYKTPVQNGIRMARKQLSVDLLSLPVPGPEAAQ
jgi:DNA repair exonuclease SbcCD ATPase subunit